MDCQIVLATSLFQVQVQGGREQREVRNRKLSEQLICLGLVVQVLV